ncbi:hypothetical protein ID0084_08730 [Helicobacter pylori]
MGIFKKKADIEIKKLESQIAKQKGLRDFQKADSLERNSKNAKQSKPIQDLRASLEQRRLMLG